MGSTWQRVWRGWLSLGICVTSRVQEDAEGKLEITFSLRTCVQRCFEAGALATGATLEVVGGTRPYAEMHHDHAIAAIYRANAEALGRKFPDLPIDLLRKFAGSTDMGNVSRIIPSIHPFIGIESWPAINHQAEFAAVASRRPPRKRCWTLR
jgi:metal-dependent amidase/aminoacylase/carboxypeptidase family protein